MAQTMRVKTSDAERQQLETHLKKGVHSSRTLTRARILLLADRADGERRRNSHIALVTGKLKTHGIAAKYEAFEAALAHRLARRFEWHGAPGCDWWLNIVEIELCVLARQCLNWRLE